MKRKKKVLSFERDKNWVGEERPFIQQTGTDQCMCWDTLSNGDAKMSNPGLLASGAPSFVPKIFIQ